MKNIFQLALKVSVNHEEEAFIMDLMKENPKLLTEVLLSQENLLMNQSDPIFIQCILETLVGSDLIKVIEHTGNARTQENIFHTLASELHFESCQFLVDNLEDVFVAKLMLTRSSNYKKSPLILALSPKTKDFTLGSQESEKVVKPHPQSLVATLFWKTCEKAVLNNPSLMESLKVHNFFSLTLN